MTPARKLPLSAFIICRNEEAYLENCVRSLAVCSDIVIVDSGSTDGTEGVVTRLQAEGFPIRFFRKDWSGYSAQKQFALDQCSQEWRLNLDADERLDAALISALPDMLAVSNDVNAWSLELRPYLVGYGFTPPGVGEKTKLRLVRRGRAEYDLTRVVHEGMNVEGRTNLAKKGSILHYRPLLLDELIPKLNQYSTLKADQIAKNKGRPRYLRILINPIVYFFRAYLRRGMIRCGVPGFIEAVSSAIYSFLTEAKIYQRHAISACPPSEQAPGQCASQANETATLHRDL